MLVKAVATIVAGLTITFISRVEAAPCSSVPVLVDVTPAVGVQDFTDAINCTGAGFFNVTWLGSLQIEERFEVSSQKNVTITGIGSSTPSTIDAGNATDIFQVSDGSTLTINNMVLNGGFSALKGGAVNVVSSSYLYISNCEFTNNNALDIGGAIYASSSDIYIDSSTLFANNTGKDGGAMYVDASDVTISGTTLFKNNSAELDDGGAISSFESGINIDGNTSFEYNSAVADDGGAMYARSSTVTISGNTSFYHNSANESGGAVSFKESDVTIGGTVSFGDNSAGSLYGGAIYANGSLVSVRGITTFSHNSANETGGAIFASASDFDIDGITSFKHNSAKRGSGGAIYVYTHNFGKSAAVRIDGDTSFVNNTARDHGGAIYVYTGSSVQTDGDIYFASNTAGSYGGAVRAYKSALKMSGNAVFFNNSAEYGGAMNTLASTTTINGIANFTHNEALNGGGLYSAQGSQVNTHGTISFVGNAAIIDGGAMYLTDPATFNISGVTFTSNEAGFTGGAVCFAATDTATGAFHDCQFEDNKSSIGGALYLSPGEGKVSVHKSGFTNNRAGVNGGAIFNTGELLISTATFTGNAAVEEGLAIFNFGSDDISLDATFDGNILSCPLGEYNDDEDPSESSTCRFSLVCAHCSNGCETPSTVKIDERTVPVCEQMPTGVQPSSTSITVAEFNLEQGYYRLSNESRYVLECYQPDACAGGVDAANYCASGYEGPYCAVCVNGTAPGITGGCLECSGERVRSGVCLLALLLILVSIAVVSAGSHLLEDGKLEANRGDKGSNSVRVQCHRILRNGRNLLVAMLPFSSIRIVVVVLEIITQFTEIAGTVYPDEYEVFISKMALSNVDISFILSSFCIVRTSFYDRLLFATVGPLVLLLAVGIMYAVAKRRNRDSEQSAVIVKHKHLSIVLFVTFVLYSYVSFTIFRTFVCDTVDEDGQFRYLRADLSISCTTDKYKAYRRYAILMACIYPIGIPLVFGWWLVRNRQALKKPDRETMVQLKPFRGLWAAYRPSRYYYEIVEYCRRVMLTGVAVFVFPGSSTQIAVIVLLAVVFLFVSESLSPFESRSDMWLYRWGNGIILASMYVALLLSVDITEDNSNDARVVSGLLISANLVMILAVAVQAVLSVAGLCTPAFVIQEVNCPRARTDSMRSVHPTEHEGLDCEMVVWFGGEQTPGTSRCEPPVAVGIAGSEIPGAK